MDITRCAAAVALAGLLLGACSQREHSAKAPAQPPMQDNAASVAANGADPSLPPADVAGKSKPLQDPALTEYDSKKPIPNPAAETGQDASHSALTADERDRQMPMKGQANDYNTPDRAKEQDQPRTAEKEPGGQEAKAGNQSQ